MRRDLRAVRSLIKRVKCSARLAEVCIFGRRNRVRLLEYLDRRNCYRSDIEIPIHVTPVAFDGTHVEPLEEGEKEMLAFTRDMSRKGVGFLHDEPLEGEYAIVTVDLLDGCPASLLLEVRWSNAEPCDTYMSAGRFIGIIDTR